MVRTHPSADGSAFHPTTAPATADSHSAAVAAPIPVEALSGSALAQAVAVEVMGWTGRPGTHIPEPWWYDGNRGMGNSAWWQPQEDMGLAWRVIERLHQERFCVRIEVNRHGWLDLVSAWRMDTHPLGSGRSYYSGIPATEPSRAAEAICRVALKAIREQAGGGL